MIFLRNWSRGCEFLPELVLLGTKSSTSTVCIWSKMAFGGDPQSRFIDEKYLH